MKTYLTLACLFALALNGCGLFSSSSSTTPAPAAAADEEPAEPSAYAWQTELRRPELGKITEKLWLWLDGDAPEGLDLASLGGEDRLRITAKLDAPLDADQVGLLTSLGLEATEGDDSTTGLLTRQQLLDLAREANVVRIDPAADAEAAQAETDRRERRQRRAAARRRASRM